MQRKRRSLLFAALVLAVTATALIDRSSAAPRPATQPAAAPAGEATGEPLKVVFFGDSITGHRPATSYQGQYLKFSDLVGLMLEARVGLGRVQTVNCGYAGDATYPQKGQGLPGAVNRVDEDVIERKPDVAVVLIGGNDRVGDAADRKRTARNLKQIVGRIREAGIRTLVMQYPPAMPTEEHAAEGWDHLSAKNDLIAAAAKAHDAALLDLGPPMKAAAAHYPTTDLVNPVDGVHLHPRGEMVVARAIFNKLDELNWIEPPKDKQ